jgi:Domain of unknown function (DUF5666)
MEFTMNQFKPWLASGSLILSVAVGLTLNACGGGSGSSGTSSASTGTSASTTLTGKEVTTGTVTGFGSTIIEGQKYDDSSASVLIEDDAANPRQGTTGDVKLGAQVHTKSNGSTASDITVRSEVVGKVSSVAADGFVVAGVTVKVSTDTASPTVFDGLTGLSDLTVNDFVEVHGQRDASDNVIASRIERRDPTSTVFTKVSGTVAALDATAKTFTLGGLTVNYGAAVKVLPSLADIALGKRVTVFSETAITANTLMAKTLVVRGASSTSGDAARVAGRIRDLDFAAKTFVLDGVSVDASAATFTKGTVSDLANGRRLRAIGSFTSSKLMATEVSFVKDQGDALVDLRGGITDFVSASSFKVRGVPVDASAAGITYTNGSATNLGNFVVVRIKGNVSADVVKPSEIEFVTTADDSNTRAYLGEVKNYDVSTGAFTLFNVSMKLLATTSFINEDGTTALKADFSNGDPVAVKGHFVGGTFEVSAVTFRSTSGVVINHVEGIVGSLDSTAGTFRLNSQLIKMVAATKYEGLLSSLKNGVRVEVSGSFQSGVLTASLIEIKTPRGLEASELRGSVNSFVSLANFKVGSTAIDASSAIIEKGSAADLSNGDFVEIRGQVVNGVLKATNLRFQR